MRVKVLAFFMMALLVTPISITPRSSAVDSNTKASLKQDDDSEKKVGHDGEGESKSGIDHSGSKKVEDEDTKREEVESTKQKEKQVKQDETKQQTQPIPSKKVTTSKTKKAVSTSVKPNSSKKTSKSKKQSHVQAGSQELMEDKQVPHSRSFWGSFLLYIAICVAMAVGGKYAYYPTESIFVIIIDMLMMASNFWRNKGKGYKAAEYTEEVDNDNTITYGYSQEKGRQLFWERNSVEGI